MKDEIKVNEYIRTDDGRIYKLEYLEDEVYLSDKFYYKIVKHSPNIIDLIQSGDYVNGYKVLKKSKKVKHKIMICVFEDEMSSNWITISNENIETIVTKEQFESISYKV